MRISRLMIYRATVQRNTETGTNAHGHKNKPVWTAHILSLPCWVYNDNRRLIVDGTKTGTLQGLRISYALNADVNEGDRITNIKNRRGQSIYSGTYSINQATRKYTHMEADLRVIE